MIFKFKYDAKVWLDAYNKLPYQVDSCCVNLMRRGRKSKDLRIKKLCNVIGHLSDEFLEKVHEAMDRIQFEKES